VPELLEHAGPAAAFQTWVTGHLAPYMITKHGLAKALAAATAQRGTLPATAVQSIRDAMDALLRANAEAGLVRPGLDAETVLRSLMGLLYLDPDGDWQHQTAELVDLVWRGIRSG
jgi:hypothetical protein